MIDIGKIVTALECCVTRDKNGASLCEECPYGEKGACAYLDKVNRYKQIAQKAYFSGEKLTSVEAVIASLYDQARDKDRLADDDEVSIFAEDARFLREAAVLLEAGEPRVLSLEELMGFDGAFLVEYNPAMITRDMNWAMFHFMDERRVHIWRPRMIEHYAREQYGKTWRCWTSRPTNEQREAEPWD